MEPLTWGTVINLIGQVGLAAAQKLIKLWETKAQVTSAQFDELIALENQTARDRMLLVLKAQGIDPNSEPGKALLNLTV